MRMIAIGGEGFCENFLAVTRELQRKYRFETTSGLRPPGRNVFNRTLLFTLVARERTIKKTAVCTVFA